MSYNDNVRIKLTRQSMLRPSKVSSEVVYKRTIDVPDFPNLPETGYDYAIVSCVSTAQSSLLRELYGTPEEFDEHRIEGKITTLRSFDLLQSQDKLLDTLLVGGQSLYSMDRLFYNIYPAVNSDYVNPNRISETYDDLMIEEINRTLNHEKMMEKEKQYMYKGAMAALKDLKLLQNDKVKNNIRAILNQARNGDMIKNSYDWFKSLISEIIDEVGANG